MNHLNFEATGIDHGRLRERLADEVHKVWSEWMTHQFDRCSIEEDGRVLIPRYYVERWNWQCTIPFEKLPEIEQKSDYETGDRFLQIVIEEFQRAIGSVT